MTYNPSIPLSTDLISNSQAQLLTNFGQLNTIFAFDHYTFNDATTANRGLHKQVTFPAVLGGDPSPAGAAGEVYTKAVSGVTELFFANAATVFQLSGGTSTVAAGVTGIKLASGLIVNYSSNILNFTSGGNTITFAVAYTAAPAIVAIPQGGGSTSVGLAVANVSTTTFKGFSSNASANIYFIAIGF